MTTSKLVVIMLEGMSPAILEQAISDGRMPWMASKLGREWASAPCLGSFPSAAPSAYLAPLTGHFPGTLDLPGSTFLAPPDQDLLAGYAQRPLLTEPQAIGHWLDRHILLMDEAILPSEVVHRLIARAEQPHTLGEKVLGLLGLNRSSTWERTLQETRRRLQKARTLLLKDLKLLLLHLEAPGWISRNASPKGPELGIFLSALDDFLREIHASAEQLGQLEGLQIILLSPFAWSECALNRSLEDLLHVAGLTLAPRRVRPDQPAVCAALSGTGCAHLYFPDEKGRRQRLTLEGIRIQYSTAFESLLEQPEVDYLIAWDEAGNPVVRSEKGTGRLVQQGTGFAWRVEGEDPLQRLSQRENLSALDIVEPNLDELYPDALLQLIQLRECPRRGDLILLAKPHISLLVPSDGAKDSACCGTMSREHVQGFVVTSFPLRGQVLRTADVYPTILELFGNSPNREYDGRSMLEKRP